MTFAISAPPPHSFICSIFKTQGLNQCFWTKKSPVFEIERSLMVGETPHPLNGKCHEKQDQGASVQKTVWAV